MPMKLPGRRATDVVAVVTFGLFVLLFLGGLLGDAAVVAGFIPARVGWALAGVAPVSVPWLPVWLTPLSATFVHAGWMHIAFNMLMLVFCGRAVEALLGRWPTVAIYLVGAYAAAAAQWLADPAGTVPMIGASGAISALIGTYALIYSQRAVRSFGPIPAHVVRMAWLAAAWIGLQYLIHLAGGMDAFFGGIAVAAHIGGFLAGLILTRPLLGWRFRRRAGVN